jgi:hypothetical protein
MSQLPPLPPGFQIVPAQPAQPQPQQAPRLPQPGQQALPPMANPRRDRMDAATLQAQQAAQQATETRLGFEAIRTQLAEEEAARKREKDALDASEKAEELRRKQIGQDRLATTEPALQALNKARPLVDWTSTGLGGAFFQFVPGSDARQLNAQLKTVKSNIARSTLQSIREASPTGGALGNVSDKDIELLENAAGALNPTDFTAPEFREQLDSVGRQFVSTLRRWGYSDEQIERLNPLENFMPSVTGQEPVQRDPSMRRVRLTEPQVDTMSTVSNMFVRGDPDEAILAELERGFPGEAPDPQLLEMLRQRRDPNSPISQWMQANPGRALPFGRERFVPATEGEQTIGELMQSGPGAFATGAASPVLSAVGTGAFMLGATDTADDLARGMRMSSEEQPLANLAGSFAGGAFVPGGAGLSVGRQALLASGLGAVEGFGSTEGGFGERLGGAALGGTVAGVATPALRGLGLGATTVGADTARAARGSDYNADAALRDLGITPDVMRQRAADFRAGTGRAPRIADLLTPEEARRLAPTLRGSDEAASDISEAAVRNARQSQKRLAASTRQSGEEIISPITIRARVSDEADQAFGAIRDSKIDLDPTERLFLREVVAQEVAPKSAQAKSVWNDVLDANAPITVGMLDQQRKRLRTLASRNPNEGYKEAAEQVEDMIARRYPKIRDAISNYRTGMEIAEGAEQVGRRVTGQGADSGLIDFNAVLAQAFTKTKPGTTTGQNFLKGAQAGARSGIFQDALESPAGAYRLATNLSENAATRERLTSVLGPEEANRVIAAAAQEKQSVDAFMGLAGVRPDAVPEILGSAGDMAQVIATASQGASSFAYARLVENLAQFSGVRKPTAEKLALRLLNPSSTDEAIRVMGSRKISRQDVNKVMQNALFWAAQNIAGRTAAGAGPEE